MVAATCSSRSFRAAKQELRELSDKGGPFLGELSGDAAHKDGGSEEVPPEGSEGTGGGFSRGPPRACVRLSRLAACAIPYNLLRDPCCARLLRALLQRLHMPAIPSNCLSCTPNTLCRDTVAFSNAQVATKQRQQEERVKRLSTVKRCPPATLNTPDPVVTQELALSFLRCASSNAGLTWGSG